ncbi:choice-of-anchor I family protein [Paenibacillus psychroresistens]|uniref:choice-of-anchor I family protein n=1 Tax=Paenibacillus psychroresistens TaxID=1778678 RepID=UPI001390F65E|nr:choice-of-anchor I family protein [Paenibacillus psychroresistens]
MIFSKKKLLSLLLVGELLGSLLFSAVPVFAAGPLAGTPYNSNNVYDVTVPHIIINQVYGGGLVDDNGIVVSNGFIELYNPTNSDIDLSTWSLQYADNGANTTLGTTGNWDKLNLTGEIAAHSSFLIKAKKTGPALTTTKLDLSSVGDMPIWNRYINNKGLKVILMSNQDTLTEKNPFSPTKLAGYVDMIGTGDKAIDGYEGEPPLGDDASTSKKKSLRRNSFIDTDNNKNDFKQVNYDTASPTLFSQVKPRSGADGPWFSVVSITAAQLSNANVGSPYFNQVPVIGGKSPYEFSATNLPIGLSINTVTGLIYGTPNTGTEGARSVTVTVYDSTTPTKSWETKVFPLSVTNVPGIADSVNITQLASYSVGSSNKDGGVAEIVKFNKENNKFYLVNGSTNPPRLEIVSMTKNVQTQELTLTKEKELNVKVLSETNGFVYGDLTSVDVNTTTDRVSISVQEKDPTKSGKILVLDYDGNLLKSYEAGVQPDMIKTTTDGRYILTADEAEPRDAVIDPEGSITIVDTTNDAISHVKFDNPDVIADDVHIRGESTPGTGVITGSGIKADAIRDFEPEYITLSDDNTLAYVSLQENNAIATINIAGKTVTSVKGLGLKNLNSPNNSLDLLNDSQIKLENVPFKGMYMPDGIASYTVSGVTYLFTGNEGDVTDWSSNRKNGSTIGAMRLSLNSNSDAAKFLSKNGTTYDSVEVASDMGHDDIYLYGGRSFSVWNASTMSQVFDSGNDFETITSQRVPLHFNTSNSKILMDDRSPKKGPEPEDIKVGKVGNKLFAFIGLERMGGIMTYDVTNPGQPVFANYLNNRTYSGTVEASNGPEGIDFIPATMSPTGLPLILVANEVGGTVAVMQMNVTKVSLNQSNLTFTTGSAAKTLTATVTPVGQGAATATWSSSNPEVATVNSSGQVTPVAAGTAIITAISADGYGSAEAKITVKSPAIDTLSITQLTYYSVGTSNGNGGVAEIVKFNKENNKFYLVNGSTNPPTLEIVSMTKNAQTQKLELTKEKALDVKTLSETSGFLYGDLTSVDVNTTTNRVSVSIQELDPTKPGKILVLDYDGKLMSSYEAGVQPDMIKSTADGRYILTADEGEPRNGTDPDGSVTIVDTMNSTISHVKFDNQDVIADNVHIRGASTAPKGLITGSGSKADAVHDFEPEYITLSDDNTIAYVSLQENNAIAEVNIAGKVVTSVKGLGLKDLSLPNNSLDLLKADNQIKLENVPFKGMYMPDGIASYTVDGVNYLFSGNEGDVTEWGTTRNTGSKIGDMKGSLDPTSSAANFLSNKGTTYDSVEVTSDMGHDSIYLFGGRSFSVWNASTMAQVFDSGNDFEMITSQRVPANFNSSNDKAALDSRSSKKGPEPEDIKVGKIGSRLLAFIGLERTGGLMAYDVTDPTHPTFASYLNPRTFEKDIENFNGPEGIDLIPATSSPTGLPLILVANEVGGTVSVMQMNVAKVALDQSSLTFTTGGSAKILTATVIPTSGDTSTTVTWLSSNSAVATVNSSGQVSPVSAGTAIISAISADGYGIAEATVAVNSPSPSNPNPSSGPTASPTPTPTPSPTATPSPTPAATAKPDQSNNGDTVIASTNVTAVTDSNGIAKAAVSNSQVDEALLTLSSANASQKEKVFEINVTVDKSAKEAVVTLSAASFDKIAGSDTDSVSIAAGIGQISFDKKSISTISSAASNGDISISIAKKSSAEITKDLPAASQKAITDAISDHPIFDFTVTADGKQVSNFAGGIVSINVPYVPTANEDSNAIIIYYIADNGDIVLVPNCVFDKTTGTLSFAVSHFSQYAIGYKMVAFTDTSTSFAKDNITFLAARNIILGIESNKFAPKNDITRADFVLILARLAEADLTKFKTVKFNDVPSDAYYAQAVGWATESGVTSGTATDTFDPKAKITREQMAVMIVRLSKLMAYTLPATIPSTQFADQALIPEYAIEASKALQQAGIINGKTKSNQSNVFFAPKDNATREEAAKMIALFLQQKNN